MQSMLPGMVGQIKGIPTRHMYCCVTVFIDLFSRLSLIQLQKLLSSGEGGEEMLHAKMAFKGFAHALNVHIQHCHADNRRFCKNWWLNNIKKENQTISFWGVNAHCQNRGAEHQIRDLPYRARTSLLHAKERWSKAISVHLGPHAVRHRNAVIKASQKISKRASPIELSLSTTIHPQLNHFHASVCPTYRLNSRLQAGKIQTKWEQQAKPATYLGRFPKHTSSIPWALYLSTAHVFPHFHLEVDSLFEKSSLTRQSAQAHQSSHQILRHVGQGKDGRSMILKKGPLHSMPGNLIVGADAPDMEGVPIGKRRKYYKETWTCFLFCSKGRVLLHHFSFIVFFMLQCLSSIQGNCILKCYNYCGCSADGLLTLNVACTLHSIS
jgi:hypothetical protein